jgi:DsbC/DsbD-like thiol-disulfide interchange protein
MVKYRFWKRSISASTVVLCILILLEGPLFGAQTEVLEVKTYLSQDGVQPGGTIDVAFVLDILPGWHINAPELADPFLIPCTLLIEEENSVEAKEVLYPLPETRSYSFSEVDLQVYEGKVILGARVHVSEEISQGKNVLKASFLYQACDDVSCMAPETLEFEIPFRVVSESAEIKKIHQEIFAQIKFR